MAHEFLSLLDITKRAGTDSAVGLVEEVLTVAPEFRTVMGRTIPGTSYKARVRTARNEKGAFRNANEGVEVGKSSFEQKRFDCFFFDTQLQVDEAVLQASAADGDSPAAVLADEASGAFEQSVVSFGKQFYNGASNDGKGYPGLKDFLSSDLIVDATGSGGTTWRAWFLWMHPQGVHFLFGANRGIQMNDWTKQQVRDANSKAYMAMVNNISGYVGLSCASVHAVGCVKNITSAKPLTDSLALDLVGKFKVGRKPNLCFVTRDTSTWLQKSRSVTVVANIQSGGKTANGSELVAPTPTSIAGVPLIETDCIASEAAF